MARTRDQLELFHVAAVGPADVSPEVRATAAALPAEIHLGTSSWSFPGWVGLVYDRRAGRAALARDGLAAYAKHPVLRSVGVDRSYYAPLDVETWRSYAEAVPDDFRFLVKAPEICALAHFSSGPRYEARAGEPNERFLDPGYAIDEFIGPVQEGLGKTAGPLLFQFPPQRSPDAGELAERVHRFLTALPQGPLYAFEIRRRAWLTPALAQALREGGGVPCLNVHPSMPDLPSQVRAFGGPDAWPALVVRWMLGGRQRYEEARDRYSPFDRIVDPDPSSRDAIADLCAAAVRARKPTFVIANNKAEGSAPLSILRLAERIAARSNA